MSPFANSPELWLTNHLQRQIQNEKIVKIQAVAKGFLTRRRSQREAHKSLEESIEILVERLQPPKNPKTLAELMRHHRLDVWADQCPPASEAVVSMEANKQREACLFNAKITLRLRGESKYVPDLEWADYHERSKALHALWDVGSPNENLWTRFKKYVLG
jgi:hypothetical protein